MYRTCLSPAVSRALDAASRRAAHESQAEIRPRHLLEGLLEEGEGTAAALLLRMGASANYLRAIAERQGEQAVPEQVAQSCTLAKSTRAILDHAQDLATLGSADRTVTGEVLLLALLQKEPSLQEALEAEGLVPSRLAAEFARFQAEPIEPIDDLQLAEPTDWIGVDRILDAAFNRAREGLRVVEDYSRFVLDDAFLTGRLKQLRHDLADAVSKIPTLHLLAARETIRDVGTALSTSQEWQRASLSHVVTVNWKRLQEALRSLEEFGKVYDPQLGKVIEQLRYQSYTLERAMGINASARHILARVRLCLILAGSSCAAALDWTIREAVAGGVGMVQLREKTLDDQKLLLRAREVRRWTREARAVFIVNDRPDIARLAEADGVHLGQDDLPVKDARRILGREAIIGVSTHNLEQLRQAILDGADYVGVGPVFPSQTKEFPNLAGLEFVRQASAETTLPAFVIGGITPETLGTAVGAGARRAAVSQALCGAADPRATAAKMIQLLDAPADPAGLEQKPKRIDAGHRCPYHKPFHTGNFQQGNIMAVPKRRTSHARQGKRRSHLHLKPIQIQYCQQCGEPILPHRVCPNCGHYQGREVVNMEEQKSSD